MIYEITCIDPNGETKTFTIQDTDKIKITMENNDEGNFVVFTNEFNQSTEKSSEMANIFNFLSKDDKNFSISININENKFTFAEFSVIKNIRFSTLVNSVKENSFLNKAFSSIIQIEI